jgi:hypothetical protein
MTYTIRSKFNKQIYTWRVSSSGIWRHVVRQVSTAVSEEHRLHLQGRRNKFSKNQQATLKMEAICSSETSVETRETTRLHIPKDDILHNHRCENLKSYIDSYMCTNQWLLWVGILISRDVQTQELSTLNRLKLPCNYNVEFQAFTDF